MPDNDEETGIANKDECWAADDIHWLSVASL